jgi:pilus assembly protein CpaC
MTRSAKAALRAPALLALAVAAGAAPAAQAASATVEAPTAALKLEAGKGRLIRLDRPATTLFVADPKIADVQAKSPTLVYVVAKQVGATNLYAVGAHDQVVADLDVVVGFDEARLRQTLKAQFPDSDIEVSSVSDALILSGRVGSAAEGDEILRTAARFLPGDPKEKADRLINRLVLDAPNQVNLRVRVAEVTREADRALGFNWNAAGQAGSFLLGLASGNPAATALTSAAKVAGAQNTNAVQIGGKTRNVDVNVLLDALEQKNLVTVLAEPNLTAVSGEPASFLAGGEYPIPVPQGLNAVTIDYKKFGVSLSFVATILDDGRISLKVAPEVSQLSTSGAIVMNGITVPALTTRRAETTVELGSGQSFAIAGLLQKNITQDVSKFPGLGDTPILGPLFRSKQFQKSESELVIIVTPYLVKPVSQHLATPADLFTANETVAAAQGAKTEKAD